MSRRRHHKTHVPDEEGFGARAQKRKALKDRNSMRLFRWYYRSMRRASRYRS